MSISLVQTRSGGNGGGNSQSTAALATTTTGNMLFVAVTYNNSLTPKILSLTDGLNSFGRLSKTTDANNYITEVYWCPNITGKTTPTITVTVDTSAFDISITAREYSSTKPLVFDKSAVAAVTAQNPSSGATASTTVANELVIGVYGGIGNQTISAGSGYGNYTAGTTQSSDPFSVLEDKQVSSTGTQTATFTTSASGNGVVGVYTFYEQTASNTIKDLVTYHDILTQDYTNSGAGTTTYQEEQFSDTTRDYRHKFQWDPAQFDGITEVYFETMAQVNSGTGNIKVKLRNETDNTDITGSEVTVSNGTVTTATRSGNIVANMPTAPKVLVIYYQNSNGTISSDLVTGRLVIRQQNATKFEQSPLFDQANTVSNTTTPTFDTGSSIWLYEASKYDGLKSIRWELAWAINKGVGNTGTVDFWDITSSTAIDTQSTTTLGGTYMSQDIKHLLTDGHEYGIRFTSLGTAGPAVSTTIGGARLRIAQSTPTKTQFLYTGLIAGLFADTENDGFFIDPTWYGNYSPHMWAQMSYQNNSGTGAGYGSSKDANVTGTEWTNARLTASAGDTNEHRVRGGTEMTFPSVQKWYRPYSVTTVSPGTVVAAYQGVVNMVAPPTFTRTHTTSAYLGPRRPTRSHTTDVSLYSGANFKTDYFAFSFSTPSFTRTHTTDTNKRKSGLTRTHSTDILKRKAVTLTHTTDTLKRKQNTKTHTTDVNKLKTGNLKTHTTDVNKRKSITKTHTTDVNKRLSSILRTHSTDTLKRAQNVRTHSTDTLKRVSVLKTHSTDIFKRAAVAKTHTTDVNKRLTGNLKIHSTDVNKRKATTLVHSTDVNKRLAGILRTHSTDTNKRKAGILRTHSTDVFLHSAVTRSHTTDVNKRLTGTKTHSTDTLKRKVTSRIHSTDVNKLKTGNLRTHTTDVNKRKTGITLTHLTDTLKRSLNTRTHTTDVLKRALVTKTHSTDVLKRKATTKTHLTDVNKKKAGILLSHSTDVNKLKTAITRTHTTDILKRSAVTKTHTTDVNKRLAGATRTHTTDINKRLATLRTHTTDVNKRLATVRTHTTDVNKRKSAILKTHTTDVLLRKANTRSHTTDVNKRKLNTITHSTDINKRKVTTRTHTTDVLKRKTVLRTHTTDVFKYQTLSVSHSTDTYLRSISDYSREDNMSIPTGITDLSTAFSYPDYGTVATIDSTYVDQSGDNNELFLFKREHTNSVDAITVTVVAKSTTATTVKTAYMQIWNYTTSTWETIGSDSSTAANTDFTITGSQLSDMSNYYSSNIHIIRIYQ